MSSIILFMKLSLFIRRVFGLAASFSALLLILSPGMAQSDSVNVPFAIGCPFATVIDSISSEAFRTFWKDGTAPNGEISQLVVRSETLARFKPVFGEPGAAIKIAEEPIELVRTAGESVCALVPVIELTPDLKRIMIDGAPAPWDDAYSAESDFLSLKVAEDDELADRAFDPAKATRLLLTGTTALTRNTAFEMSKHSIEWPGEAVKDLFNSADIRHISNESSFWSHCPAPRSSRTMQFCSPADYWRLFADLGVNLIEMTGNHLRDYDWHPLLETFETFEHEGFSYYGAGRTVDDAARPYEVRHHGNDFIFFGCNSSGPEHVFVTEKLPGVNRCDFDQLEDDVRRASAQGKIVVVTLQYSEAYSRLPGDYQHRDFTRISAAGAAIVSGSQAHYAQSYAVASDRIIHYGLGNLFFDQMDIPIVGTRQELLDRSIFYDGRLLTTEVKSCLLTEFARPVPMTDEERSSFLTEILSLTEMLPDSAPEDSNSVPD